MGEAPAQHCARVVMVSPSAASEAVRALMRDLGLVGMFQIATPDGGAGGWVGGPDAGEDVEITVTIRPMTADE